MIFREAGVADIPQLHRVRIQVKENVLSNPGKVTYDDYEKHLTTVGKGWLCEIHQVITGFAIVNLSDHNVWALFVDPAFEGRGIGKNLHALMLNWYFTQTKVPIWLSTSPGTRAEAFYKKQGWTAAGPYGTNEVKFQMHYEDWINNT